jgi:hypothetical protein
MSRTLRQLAAETISEVLADETNAEDGTLDHADTIIEALERAGFVIRRAVADRDVKIAELKREIALREQVYPGSVKMKRMTQSESDQRIATMKAILADYGG